MIQEGLEVIDQTDTKEELEASWQRWNKMSDRKKKLSDRKAIELFGMNNQTHYRILQLIYN